VLDLGVKRERRFNVRLSQDEMCQLDSLFINLEIPMYSDEAGRNLSQSERFRMLLDVLAPKMDYWHWLKWSRVTLREDGVLRFTRRYELSPDDDSKYSNYGENG
jgi:hypothetical protein